MSNVLSRQIIKLYQDNMRQHVCRGEYGNASDSDFCRAGVFGRTASVCIAYYSVFSTTDRNRPSYQLLDRLCSASLEFNRALKRGRLAVTGFKTGRQEERLSIRTRVASGICAANQITEANSELKDIGVIWTGAECQYYRNGRRPDVL